ncbi:MAG: gliding motility-associated C-terminal domain-containing protein [Lewinellaceae bacterium]|nr:gliding motility-associated C-terminal domain-containing protein [Lewinellaceae bacterium]
MKKHLSFWIFFLLCTSSAWAQFNFGSATFSFSSAAPCEGEEACIDVTVEDFTNITYFKFPILWDPTVVAFKRIEVVGLPELTIADFNQTRVSEGLLLVEWAYGDCSTPNTRKVTLDDKTVLFRICFEPIASYGDATTISITDSVELVGDDQPIELFKEAPCINTGLFQRPGVISTCVRALSLYTEFATADPGEVVCVDVSSTGLDSLVGLQFTMTWDSTVLAFEDVRVGTALDNLSESSFGIPASTRIKDALTFTWSSFGGPAAVRDSVPLFNVCFTVIGDCQRQSLIQFNGRETPLEATSEARTVTATGKDTTVLNLITIAPSDGGIQVGECNPPGWKVHLDCGSPVTYTPAPTFAQQCVSVIADERITDLSEINFLVQWDPTVLTFQDIKNQFNIFNLNVHFIKDNVSNGVLGVRWTRNNPRATIEAGTKLFDICFNITGLGSNLSPVKIIRESAIIRKGANTPNVGLAPTNCAIEIIQPAGVAVLISDEQAPPGDTVCFDFELGNFIQIDTMRFGVVWNTDFMKFVEPREINLPNATTSNFDLNGASSGLITFEWMNSTAVTRADGEKAFALCFEVTGTPPGELGQDKNCDVLEITDFFPAETTSPRNNGQRLPITSERGEICVQNPNGFFLIVDNKEALQGDTVCVRFRTSEFKDILATQFDVKWDVSGMQFVSLDSLNATLGLTQAANFVVDQAGVGILSFDWTSATAASLPDTSTLFAVCFQAIGPVEACYDIEVDNEPTPSVTTVVGAGSVYPLTGKLCIKDQLVITSVEIQEVSCFDARDGSVKLTVTGGQGPLVYSWTSSPAQFTPEARNLGVGQITVAIFDSENPSLILRDTFEVPLTESLPTAFAGQDKLLPCSPAVTFLTGTAPPTGTFTYLWRSLGAPLPGENNKTTVLVNNPGNYIFQVTNERGCVATDTVEVFPSNLPIVDAGDDLFFNCKATELFLAPGPSTSAGDTISYQWTALDNGLITPGDETKLTPQVEAPGTYVLAVRFRETGCTATDTVIVRESTVIPNANAGTDQELGCDGTPATLSGSGSANQIPVLFEWFNSQGTSIGRSAQIQVTELGDYILAVTDEANGCVSTDTVAVIPSPDYPSIQLPDSSAITCLEANPVLTAVVGNATDIALVWTPGQGGTLRPGTDTTLTPVVETPGTFILTVTNNASSCVSSDTIVVTNEVRTLAAEAGTGGTITCEVTSVTLQGTADLNDPRLSFLWELDGATVAKDTLGVEVFAAGTYFLRVVDTLSGCSAIDSVVVNSQGDIPVVSFMETPIITCADTSAVLNIAVEPAAGYSYNWTASNGGNIISGDTTALPTINAAGTYRVEVTNPLTGCVGQNEVTITAQNTLPAADAGNPATLTCATDTLTIGGSGTASGAAIQLSWTALGGGVLPGVANTPQIQVSVPGSYVLAVRDTLTGCVATDTVVVAQNVDLPMVSATASGMLTCTNLSVTLDGSAGSSQGANFTAVWKPGSSQQGAISATNNPLIVQVNQPGDYILEITNTQTGCVNTQVVTVQSQQTLPTVQVVSPAILPCPGTTITLSATGTAVGPNFSYSWQTVSGAGVVTNSTSLTPQVNTAGSYELRVTDANTGCASTATVQVIPDPTLVPANAGPDVISCGDDATLNAVLPAGTTGSWSSLDGATVETPNNSSSFVFALKTGTNRFVWRLSAATCPNYSADTTVVTQEGLPIANNDNLQIKAGSRSATVNVLTNDQLPGRNGYVVNVTGVPGLGTIDTIVNGAITYTANAGALGTDVFTYQVCSRNCPELCDTAQVNVEIEFDPNAPGPLVPNGITPNGDGRNDVLAFEILDRDPESWPDNQIVIFNRWGDIVYQARPYLNNWDGTNASGQELPQGTYYYILRLDIANGNIIRGDVTIVR